MTSTSRVSLRRRLLVPAPNLVLMAMLMIAAVLGALVAWMLPVPAGAGGLALPGGGLAGAAVVAVREWVAIGFMPEPVYEPLRTPARVDVPGDDLERTVAPVPCRPLATTRPDQAAVDRMRQLRLRVRKSTDRDAEAFRRHRKREMTVDPVGDEFARRRRQQRRLELIVSSSAAWGLVSAWFLAGGPWWVLGLKLATLIGFVVMASGANGEEGDVGRRSVVGYSPFTERGCVGGNLATADFGGAEAYGIAGERRTAELLETWLRGASRVAIFHSLRFPGSTRADIDHAVLIGHELFLVDSKAWRGGAYRQESVDTIIAPDGQERRSSMPAASAALSRSGWGDVRVVTVIHATSGRVLVTTTGLACHMVVSPVDMVEMLLEARVRESSRVPWTGKDADRFARHVEQLREMLMPTRGVGATTVGHRAA